MKLHAMLVPAYGMNDADKWRLWEEHGDCKTVTIKLDNGYYIMKCDDHNVPHLIATEQA